MLAIFLFCVYMFISFAFLSHCYRDYKVNHDSAFIAFGVIAAMLIIFMAYGFMHFKPWLTI